MNLELIIKLVKLANNNPSDNEANLAARKVCRLIEDGKFQFTEVKTAAGKVRSASNPTPNQGAQTWNDVKRSEESQWRAHYYEQPRYHPGFDEVWELLRKMREEQARKAAERDAESRRRAGDEYWKQQANRNPFSWDKTKVDFDFETPQYKKYWSGEAEGKPKKEKRDKRPLPCKDCGKEYMTAFVGPPQMFTCHECHWRYYQEGRGK
jgi:hypothetical protein